MELSEFNNHFLWILLEKILKEKKTVLLGDFNADLLKYDHDDEVADFLDMIYSKLLLPNTSSPARITLTSATLINNIFANHYDNIHIWEPSNNFVRSSSSNFDSSNPKYKDTKNQGTKNQKTFTMIFRKFLGATILFLETYKILPEIWNSS